MFDMDDPQKRALLMMGLGLLGGAPGQRKNVGADFAHAGLLGMQGYDQASNAKLKREEEKQRREMRSMQMEQARMSMEAARRQQQTQDQLRSAAGEAFRPGMEPQGPMPDGSALPPVPGGGGMADFAQRAMAIDPMEGMRYLPKPREPKFHTVGGALVQEPTSPDGPARTVFQSPEKKESPFGKINPSDYTPDSFRKFAQSGDHSVLVPYRAPREGPAGQYDSSRGVVIDPRTGQARPVTMPDGSPLAPKDKADKPLTEGQAKGSMYLGLMQNAEKSIAGIKGFDPSNLKNQTMVALARGDVPVIGKAGNLMTGAAPQKYAQATFQWTEAMLRQLTGAAAPEQEVWRQTKMFWPMPGDTKEVIDQKAEARQMAQEQMKVVAGQGGKPGGASGGWGIKEMR